MVFMNIAAYWAVTPYIFVGVIFLRMEARRSSESSVNLCQIMHCKFEEDSDLFRNLRTVLITVPGIHPEQLKAGSYFSFLLCFLFELVFCAK